MLTNNHCTVFVFVVTFPNSKFQIKTSVCGHNSRQRVLSFFGFGLTQKAFACLVHNNITSHTFYVSCSLNFYNKQKHKYRNGIVESPLFGGSAILSWLVAGGLSWSEVDELCVCPTANFCTLYFCVCLLR